MTVARLLRECSSYELTMWQVFLSARAERLEEARKRHDYDRQFE